MDAKSDRKRFTRRGVLAAGAGGAAALAVEGLAGPAVAVGASGDALGPSINGTVKAVQGGTLSLEDVYPDLEELPWDGELAPGSEFSLKVAENAPLWRSGPVGLQEFQAGDQVIAYVTVVDGNLLAQAVEPLYTAVQGVVSSVKDSQLVTDAGTVVVSDYTKLVNGSVTGGESAKSISDIQTGSRIFATCRYEPSNGTLVANTIGAV